MPLGLVLASGSLTSPSGWRLKLGIRPERIQPVKPFQNGRHRRMHRTLKEETALPPRSSLNAQQSAFDNFRDEFNRIRPHEALGFLPPSKIYKPSIREFPKKILEVAYPTHIVTDKVHESGFAQ